jgi:hypothetical protein
MARERPFQKIEFSPDERLLELFSIEGDNAGKVIPYYDALSLFGLDDTDLELNGKSFEEKVNRMLIAQYLLESSVQPGNRAMVHQLFQYINQGFDNKIKIENFVSNPNFTPAVFIDAAKNMIAVYGFTGPDIGGWPKVRDSILKKLQSMARASRPGELADFVQQLVDIQIFTLSQLAKYLPVSEFVTTQNSLDIHKEFTDKLGLLSDILVFDFRSSFINSDQIDKCLVLFGLPEDFQDIEFNHFRNRVEKEKRKILKQIQESKLPSLDESKLIGALNNVQSLLLNLHIRANNEKDKGLF